MHCPICGTQLDDNATVCWACGHSLDKPGETRFQLDPGTTLQSGKYRLDKVLGQGGFGITYVATDTSLSRKVAIKELFPEGSSRHDGVLYPPTSLAGGGQQSFQDVIDNFLEEARTVARFNHPGIVRVYNIFEENQTAYMVMEYLRGDTLTKQIVRAGKLSPDTVFGLADDLTEALSVVHDADLLHRDIKPDNIFLTGDGRTVLIDFGSARAFSQNQTVSHTRLVTPGYAPPEQYASQARFGPYTDLYALAATLHHALSGQMPPPATDRMMGTPLPSLPRETPQRLRDSLEQALAIRVEDRPADVAAFRQQLSGSAQPTQRRSFASDSYTEPASDKRRERPVWETSSWSNTTTSTSSRSTSSQRSAWSRSAPQSSQGDKKKRGSSCGGFAVGCATPFLFLFVLFVVPQLAPVLLIIFGIWGISRFFRPS